MENGIISRIKTTTRKNQRAVVFLICLFVSILFWIFTSMSRDYESTLTMPVSYRNIPFTKNLEGGLPSHLEFHYKGTGFELFMIHLRSRPDSIIVDVSKNAGQNNMINLPSSSLREQLPGELRAYRVVPEFISQSFTVREGKRIPVIAQTAFTFRHRFAQAGRLVLTPDSIDVAGPASVLEKIHSINTEPIKLNDIHENMFGSIHLSKDLPANLALSESFVYYYLSIEEYTEGEFEVMVELPVSQRNRVTLLPPSVKIRFQTDLNHFRSIKSSDFQVITSVPFPHLPAQLSLELKRYPKKIHNIVIEPRVVDYLLTE